MPFRRCCLALCLLFLLCLSRPAAAQLSKGHQILIAHGLQVQGLAQDDCYVTLSTYTNLNYSSIDWDNGTDGSGHPIHSSRNSWLGNPPGFPWSRWAIDETQMPPQVTPYDGDETPYLPSLLSLCLGDEWNLNDATTRTRLVNWFQSVRTNWPNVLLYHNNWGSQIDDASLADFYTRAQPDLLCFDTYPWYAVYDTSQPDHIGAPIGGPPTGWYGDLRRYREHARGAGLPLGIYRQTFHSAEDYAPYNTYRDPSRSEIRLNTFGALAFSATVLSDFIYNTGAGSLFTKTFNGSGDTTISTNGLYAELADANLRARNFGKALVRLTPITTEAYPGYTTSMMFIRGTDGAGNLTPMPSGFLSDPHTPNAVYSDWFYQRNDPYLTNNWSVSNLGPFNNGQPGDVIVSWFKPLDPSFEGPDYPNEVYLMVVNGLTWTNGTAADCRQQITLNFHSALGAVEMLNPLTGTAELQPLPLVNGLRQLVLTLNGGDAALFKFSDGAPFVGTQLTPIGGAPVVTLHPVNAVNLVGTDAAFSVRALGSGPLSYQWRFNGAAIPGATTNNFTRRNVQAGDVGTYTAIVSNSFGVVTSMPALLNVTAPLVYEPFNYTNVGGPVSSNTPANWTYGGSGVNDFSVVSGNLSYPGLAVAVGNSATNGGVGLGVRRSLGSPVSSGQVYFSGLFRINDLGFNTGGWSGVAGQAAMLMAPDNSSSRLQVMVKTNSPAGTGYLIGLQKGGTGASAVYDTTVYHAGDTVLLVGRYDFTTSPNSVSLWINPNPATFGTSQPPGSGFLWVNTGLDGFSIDRFNFRQNTAPSVPAAMQWDEVRIGAAWPAVTPAALPPQISTQPTNLTVSVGGTVNFSVGAYGNAPLGYQWRFNGTNLLNATNSLYTQANAQRYHAGNYSVVVTNPLGSITSATASLTVMPVTPVVLSAAAQVGGGRVSFQGSGDPGGFDILASTNLVNWTTLTNIFSPGGTFQFSDWLSNAPSRYFRVRLTP